MAASISPPPTPSSSARPHVADDEAWYRQRVEVPAVDDDRRIMLWFASVDHAAKVWLNGNELGTGGLMGPVMFYTAAE